jgi:hypothetical protein
MSTSSVMRPLSWPYHGESAPGHGTNLCPEIWCAEDLRASFPDREINEPGAIHFAHTRKQRAPATQCGVENTRKKSSRSILYIKFRNPNYCCSGPRPIGNKVH